MPSQTRTASTTTRAKQPSKRALGAQARKSKNAGDKIASHKIEMLPTPAQAERLELGCDLRRDAYNWVIAEMRHIIEHRRFAKQDMGMFAHHLLSDPAKFQAHLDWLDRHKWKSLTQLSKEFTAHMRTNPWYARYKGKVPLHIARPALKEAREAYDRWWGRLTKGLPGGYPKFRSRHDGHQSMQICRGPDDIKQTKFTPRKKENSRSYRRHPTVELQVMSSGSKDHPGIGKIKLTEEPRHKGEMRQAHITREAGRWYIIPVTRLGQLPQSRLKPGEGDTTSIDLGSRTHATCYHQPSNTFTRHKHPKAREQMQSNLERLQRKRATKKGSKKGETKSLRFKRLSEIERRMHQHTANQRKDHTHKTTTAIVAESDHVIVEDLNVRGMTSKGGTRKRGLNRNMLDANLGETQRQLGYKTAWAGKTKAQADRYYPSSQICPSCHWQTKGSSAEIWYCQNPKCLKRFNRDEMAAFNLFWQRQPRGNTADISPHNLNDLHQPTRGRGTTPRRPSNGDKKKPARSSEVRIDTSHLGCEDDKVRNRAADAYVSCRDWTYDNAGNKRIPIDSLDIDGSDRSRGDPLTLAASLVTEISGKRPLAKAS